MHKGGLDFFSSGLSPRSKPGAGSLILTTLASSKGRARKSGKRLWDAAIGDRDKTSRLDSHSAQNCAKRASRYACPMSVERRMIWRQGRDAKGANTSRSQTKCAFCKKRSGSLTFGPISSGSLTFGPISYCRAAGGAICIFFVAGEARANRLPVPRPRRRPRPARPRRPPDPAPLSARPRDPPRRYSLRRFGRAARRPAAFRCPAGRAGFRTRIPPKTPAW